MESIWERFSKIQHEKMQIVALKALEMDYTLMRAMYPQFNAEEIQFICRAMFQMHENQSNGRVETLREQINNGEIKLPEMP